MFPITSLYSILIFLLIFKIKSISGFGQIYTSAAGNKYYIENDQKYTWPEALISCMEMNMTLVTIETAEKSNDINQLVKNTFGKSLELWVGGIMIQYPQKHFIWLSTGKKFNYTYWAIDQPNFQKNEQHCVQIGYSTDMSWNDHNCIVIMGYICEPDEQKQKCEKLQQQLQESESRETIFLQELESLTTSLKQKEATNLEDEKKLKQDLEEYQQKFKELEALNTSLKQKEEKYLKDEKKLKQDLEDYQQKFKEMENYKEKYEKNQDALEKMKNKRIPYNVLHIHQDRYVANEVLQN